MKNTNFYHYVACNNPQGSYELLINAGYSNVPKNKEKIAGLLADYVTRKKADALNEIMNIHPDKEMILSTVQKEATGIKEPNGSFINCSDLSKICADATTNNKNQVSEKTINYLIIGGSVVLGTTLLTLIIISLRR